MFSPIAFVLHSDTKFAYDETKDFYSSSFFFEGNFDDDN